MQVPSEPESVTIARRIACELRAPSTAAPNNVTLIRPFGVPQGNDARCTSYEMFVAEATKFGMWHALPLFGFSSGRIAFAFTPSLAPHEGPILRVAEGACHVQASSLRQYLLRSYLDDRMAPVALTRWLEVRESWPMRRPLLLPIQRALGEDDGLAHFESVLFDDDLLPPADPGVAWSVWVPQIGRVFKRVDSDPNLARAVASAEAVAAGGEPDFEAEHGPWRAMVCSMTLDEVFTPRQAWELLHVPGNTDVSGQSISMIRFPNHINALAGWGAVRSALLRGVEIGYFTAEQRDHPLFVAGLAAEQRAWMNASTEMEHAGRPDLAWNALMTAMTFAREGRAVNWYPVMRAGLSLAERHNFPCAPVIEWIYKNYLDFYPAPV